MGQGFNPIFGGGIPPRPPAAQQTNPNPNMTPGVPGSPMFEQFANNPELMGNLQQQGQGFLDQFGQMGQQAGGVANTLANWNAQNPWAGQQQDAFNQMGSGGFNAGALQQFQNQFNPNTGTGGAGIPPNIGTPSFPGSPTQQPGQPSQQVEIGMGQAADQRFNPVGGVGPPPATGGAPFAPGVGPQAGIAAGAPPSGPTTGVDGQPQQQFGGGQPQLPPANGGGAPGGQPSNPFGVNLNQAAGPGTTTDFTGTPTTAPTPQAPGQGAGGQVTDAMLGGGQQAAGQFGGFGADVGTAQNAQLSGLLSQAQGAGMSEAQQQQMFSAQFDPAQQAIQQAQNQSTAQLSARGMGRSSAGVGNIATGAMNALGNAAQQAGANVTGQNLALTQRQSEFGLGGLGQFAGQGIGAALGAGGLENQMQGTANQMNLGMGNLGLGTEQLGSGNQMQMNQQQMQAQQQQFSQDNARAGMDLARYQTEQGFNMQQYQTDLQAAVQSGRLDEQTAARMAQNALQTTQQGLQAQGMQNQNNQAMMNAALGLGNQALDFSGQNLQAQGMAGGILGNTMGQLGNVGMEQQQMFQQGLQNQLGMMSQRQIERERNRAQGNAAAWGAAGNAIPG